MSCGSGSGTSFEQKYFSVIIWIYVLNVHVYVALDEFGVQLFTFILQ